MAEQRDDTLSRDIQHALEAYLKVDPEKQKKKHDELLQELLTKIDKAPQNVGGPEKQVSLAIHSCPMEKRSALVREALRKKKTELRIKKSLQKCPKLSIGFQDLSWSQYYPAGTNIKYPDVRGLTAITCKSTLEEKMMLFDCLQADRERCCVFRPADKFVVSAPSERQQKCPAILIPSAGKDGKWLGDALRNPQTFWWAKCIDFAQVIFLVSNQDLASYSEFPKKGVCVIGYDGFGMGCGRAVGISVAKTVGRVCIMTDDRTKDLTFNEKSVTEENLKLMLTSGEDPLCYGSKPFITGVQPKGELNILTIINPNSTDDVKPAFSPYFLASKEDKVLYEYCKAVKALAGVEDDYITLTLGETASQLQVHFDANNPPYQNTAVKYTGPKGEQLACVTASQLYRSVDGKKTFDWKYLSGTPGFKNQWDAIKMQDSAMYLLFVEIVNELLDLAKADKLTDEVRQQFRNHIQPWFT